jgi:hypothetical protein
MPVASGARVFAGHQVRVFFAGRQVRVFFAGQVVKPNAPSVHHLHGYLMHAKCIGDWNGDFAVALARFV